MVSVSIISQFQENDHISTLVHALIGDTSDNILCKKTKFCNIFKARVCRFFFWLLDSSPPVIKVMKMILGNKMLLLPSISIFGQSTLARISWSILVTVLNHRQF